MCLTEFPPGFLADLAFDREGNALFFAPGTLSHKVEEQQQQQGKNNQTY
jgi:hypothetical protein